MKSVNLAMDNMDNLQENSSKKPESGYQEFRFVGWNHEYDDSGTLNVFLKYGYDEELTFTELLQFPVEADAWSRCDIPALEKALAALHIIGGISYFKAFLPERMSGLELSDDQAKFWTKVYERGLGEFFYRNEIDFRGIINFSAVGGDIPKASTGALAESALVPIGGGKDSIVTAELMGKAGIDYNLISLRDALPIAETSRIIGKSRQVIKRQIDPLLFELNERGAWNGHIPITAYISFLLVVCAILYDKKYICMSLEKSANYGQIDFFGMDVNHQYSKSEEFEEDLRKYVSQYIHEGIEYFSFLRAFNELKIAEIFSHLDRFEKFAPLFTSCNTNFRINRQKPDTLWCGKCPKCAFVFLILAPFVDKSQLVQIFGSNLLADPELESLYEEILGLKRFKPFECVGTVEESRAALWMIHDRVQWRDDILMTKFSPLFRSEWTDVDWPSEVKAILSLSDEHFIPKEFLDILTPYTEHAD